MKDPNFKPKRFTLRKGELFKKVAARSLYMNKEIVEEVYYNMLKVIVEELKEKGELYLPDLALVYVRRLGVHYGNDINKKMPTVHKPILGIKFRVDRKLQIYFKEFAHLNPDYLPLSLEPRMIGYHYKNGKITLKKKNEKRT